MDTKEHHQDRQKHETIKGIVISRKCECRNHHEMGVTLDSGEYIPLRLGMVMDILDR